MGSLSHRRRRYHGDGRRSKDGVSLLTSNAEIPHTDFKHLLLSCCKYNPVRRKFYNVNSLQKLFERVEPQLFVAYIRE
jgi:hypothetical protein